MTAILKKNYSVFNAASFIDIFGRVYPAPSAPRALYLAVGKSEAWTNEAAPDTPTNSIDAENDLRDNLIFLKKIAIDDVSLVIPRRDFANALSGAGLNAYTLSAIDESSLVPYTNRDYYFMTSAGLVFEYTDAVDGPLTNPTLEPSSTSDVTTDGKSIRFVYTINLSSPFLTDDWMPVTYNTQGYYEEFGEPDWPNRNGGISQEQGEEGILNANQALGANHIMVSSTIGEEFLDVIESVPAEYRQIALLVDPLNTADPAVQLSGDEYGYTTNAASPNIVTNSGLVGDAASTSADADAYSGQMIYMENRVKVTRVAGQSETTKFVIEF